jgi:drug/metabolite transporter (DMT)-like permease
VKSQHAAGIAALLITTLIWSTTFPVAKSAFDHLSPALLTAARFIISALLIGPRLKGLSKPEARLGLILGLLQFLCVATVFHGLKSTGAGRSAFLISLSVFMVPLANLALRKPVRWVHLVAAVVALIGVWLFTGGSAGGGLTSGDWWIIFSAVMFAAYMLIIEAAGPQPDPLRQSAVQLLVVAVLAFIWLGVDGVPANIEETLRPVWISVLYLGICAICTTSLQVWGQRYVSAQESALIFILEPVLATVWSYWFLGEQLALTALPGAVLIIGANLWSQLDRGGVTATPAAQSRSYEHK